MVLVEGHRERGSIRITPVFPKVAIGTWFHPGDQDLPWIVGTELPRVTLPYGAVTHGCAQEDPLVEVVRPCQQALLAGLHRIRVPLRRRLHSRPERHDDNRSEEHTSELQSLMRISYAVFCLKKKNNK